MRLRSGTRVPTNTGVPLRMSGLLSTTGGWLDMRHSIRLEFSARTRCCLTPRLERLRALFWQSMRAKVTRSSGNVFRDLGFSAGEAESLRIRADLMIQIRRFIEARKLTQTTAAKVFGVTQPRI